MTNYGTEGVALGAHPPTALLELWAAPPLAKLLTGTAAASSGQARHTRNT